MLTDPARLNRLLGQVGPELVTDTGDTSLLALLAVAGKAAGAEPVAVSLPVRFEERGPYPVGMDPALAPGFLAALRED
ncbi:LytR family transcriptional regulator, partial [Micromonospora sp. HK10]